MVVARLDQLGYQLKEGVRSEVGMMIPVLLIVTVMMLAQGYCQEVRTTFGRIFLL